MERKRGEKGKFMITYGRIIVLWNNMFMVRTGHEHEQARVVNLRMKLLDVGDDSKIWKSEYF